MPGSCGQGGVFCDDPEVFASYMAHRGSVDNPNSTLEEPPFLSAIGDWLVGLRVLDLGCGDAELGRRLLTAGWRSYLGVDASERMVTAARETLKAGGTVARGAIEDFAARRPTAWIWWSRAWPSTTSRISPDRCAPAALVSRRLDESS